MDAITVYIPSVYYPAPAPDFNIFATDQTYLTYATKEVATVEIASFISHGSVSRKQCGSVSY